MKTDTTPCTTTDLPYPLKYDAPPGKKWFCMACGKASNNRAEGQRGWDESCFLNAKLIDV